MSEALTTVAAARALGFSAQTLRRAIAAGKPPAGIAEVITTPGGHYRFRLVAHPDARREGTTTTTGGQP